MNNFWYYILIYLTIITLRFLKSVHNSSESNFCGHFKTSIACSQDIVYTASGVFLSLIFYFSKTDTYYLNLATIIFILLFAISFSLEFMKDKFKDSNYLYFSHFLVILFVILYTLFVFKFTIPDEKGPKIFNVIIPYDDNTFKLNINNNKLSNRHFFYETNIKSSTIDSAIFIAIQEFKKKQNKEILPLFFNTSLDSNSFFTIQKEKIKVFQIDKKI
jgi:hypothetical protein